METPTLNVNLNAYCEEGIHCRHAGGHAPVLVPCPIPRSVTFEVRLECSEHDTRCQHAAPIRVSCTISGKTWAGSEVVEIVVRESLPKPWEASIFAVEAVCRDRWKIIRDLLVQADDEVNHHLRDLCSQRDAVFSALYEMARAEDDALQAQARVMGAAGWKGIPFADPQHREDKRPSVSFLARYVEHLISQVGALP